MRLIDGIKIAKNISNEVKNKIDLINLSGGRVNFAAVVVGDNAASHLYIKMKKKACEEVGISMSVYSLNVVGESDLQYSLNKKLKELSADEKVHGILLQLPLPEGLDAREAISYIVPDKDVDGLTVSNLGKLAVGQAGFVPCTARGVLYAIESVGIKIAGRNVCMIGRSLIVGKPTALLLCNQGATVTLCHSETRDLKSHTLTADVVIVATGIKGLVTADMIREGAIVIDVGINRLPNGKVCGDVDFEGVYKKAGAITPVPGGIGPLTIACLLSNILEAYRRKQK